MRREGERGSLYGYSKRRVQFFFRSKGKGFFPPPQPTTKMSKVSKVFRGEGDLMVDALVAASQARPEITGPNKYERDLVPYFDPGADSWDENALNAVNNNNNG